MYHVTMVSSLAVPGFSLARPFLKSGAVSI